MALPSTQSEAALQAVLYEVDDYLDASERSRIQEACELVASRAVTPENPHEDLFLQQSLDSVLHLAQFGFKTEHLAAALLIHPVSKQIISLKKVRDQLGEAIARRAEILANLVARFEPYLPWSQGLAAAGNRARMQSKRSKSHWQEKTNQSSSQAFFAIAQNESDLVVVKLIDELDLLKWADRLGLSSEVRTAIARQCQTLYAELAEMLGIWQIKWQLEDTAFQILDNATYQAIVRDLQEKREEREARIGRAIAILSEVLTREGIRAEVVGRPKHIYGIFKKLVETGKPVQEINDALGVRIVVADDDQEPQAMGQRQECPACYASLDILHRLWPPAEGIYGDGPPFRDWIARPKPNLYQSIHTTVIFDGRLLEVQIRNQTMHEWAEYGTAAHWIYKKGPTSAKLQENYQEQVKRISELRKAFEKKD